VEGLTFTDSLNRKQTATQTTMLLQSLYRIFRAGGIKPAIITKQWTYQKLVKLDKKDHRFCNHVFATLLI